LTLSFSDARRLKEAGFTDNEIVMFAASTLPNGSAQPRVELDSPVWRSVLESRREWVLDRINNGWDKYEIDIALNNYYRRKSDRSPFDFLKKEYYSTKNINYKAALRRRKQIEIERELPGYK